MSNLLNNEPQIQQPQPVKASEAPTVITAPNEPVNPNTVQPEGPQPSDNLQAPQQANSYFASGSDLQMQENNRILNDRSGIYQDTPTYITDSDILAEKKARLALETQRKTKAFTPKQKKFDPVYGDDDLINMSQGGLTKEGVTLANQTIQEQINTLRQDPSVTSDDQLHYLMVKNGYAMPVTQDEVAAYHNAQTNHVGLFSNENTSNFLPMKQLQLEQIQMDPEKKGNDGELRHLAAASLNLLYSTAGSVADLAAYGADKIGQTTGLQGDNEYQVYSAVKPYTDALESTDMGDDIVNYDRTHLNVTNQNILNKAYHSKYGTATLEAIKHSPSEIIEIVPYMVGLTTKAPLKVTEKVMKSAMERAALAGASKTAQKLAGEAAKKEFLATAHLTTKVKQVFADNAGYLAAVNTQAQESMKTFAENNGGKIPDLAKVSEIYALNAVGLALDKVAIKDVLHPKAFKTLTDLSAKLPKTVKMELLKRASAVARGMTEEASTEYLQTWTQILGEQRGANGKTISDVLSDKSNQLQATTAAVTAAGIGAAMSGGVQTPKAVGNLNHIGKEHLDFKKQTSVLDGGLESEKQRNTFGSNLDKDIQVSQNQLNVIDKVQQNIDGILNNNTFSTSQKTQKVQEQLHQAKQKGIQPDEFSNIDTLGKVEADSLFTSISQNKEFTQSKAYQDTIDKLSKTTNNLDRLNVLKLAALKYNQHITQQMQDVKSDTGLKPEAKQRKVQQLQQQLLDLPSVVKSSKQVLQNTKLALRQDKNLSFKKTKEAIKRKKTIAETLRKKVATAPIKTTKMNIQEAAETKGNWRNKTSLTGLFGVDKDTYAHVSKYSNKQLAIAESKVKKERKRLASLDRAAGKTVRKSIMHKRLEQLENTIKQVKADRKRAKQIFDPKKSVKETMVSLYNEIAKVVEEKKTAAKQQHEARKVSKEEVKAYNQSIAYMLKEMEKDENLDWKDKPLIDTLLDQAAAAGILDNNKIEVYRKKAEKIFKKVKAKTEPKVKTEKGKATNTTTKDEGFTVQDKALSDTAETIVNKFIGSLHQFYQEHKKDPANDILKASSAKLAALKQELSKAGLSVSERKSINAMLAKVSGIMEEMAVTSVKLDENLEPTKFRDKFRKLMYAKVIHLNKMKGMDKEDIIQAGKDGLVYAKELLGKATQVKDSKQYEEVYQATKEKMAQTKEKFDKSQAGKLTSEVTQGIKDIISGINTEENRQKVQEKISTWWDKVKNLNLTEQYIDMKKTFTDIANGEVEDVKVTKIGKDC